MPQAYSLNTPAGCNKRYEVNPYDIIKSLSCTERFFYHLESILSRGGTVPPPFVLCRKALLFFLTVRYSRISQIPSKNISPICFLRCDPFYPSLYLPHHRLRRSLSPKEKSSKQCRDRRPRLSVTYMLRRKQTGKK